MRMHFDSACSCGILILEIRPNFWGGWLKNGGLQEQSSYSGGKLPCSFKKRKGHLNKLRNKPENPSNINLKIFRNDCYVLEPCPECEIFEVPLDEGRTWEIEHGIMHMRRLDGIWWESETALPAQSLGLCVS